MKSPSTILLLFVFAFLSWACGPNGIDDGERPEVGIALDSLVRRIAIPSETMSKVYNANVIIPESYFLDSSHHFYPVLYLLHDYGGTYADWYNHVPSLNSWASHYDIIIVTPEGGFNSWYIDSYTKPDEQFASYISREVPQYIDAHFRTYQDARYRAISGAGMGGHGALNIALKHPDWFGLAGSIGGVTDLVPINDKFEIQQQIGPFETDSLRWFEHSAIHIAGKKSNIPILIIDCGANDDLINDNRLFNEQLSKLHIPHTFIQRPGNRDWIYREEALEFQLLFFSSKFKEG